MICSDIWVESVVLEASGLESWCVRVCSRSPSQDPNKPLPCALSSPASMRQASRAAIKEIDSWNAGLSLILASEVAKYLQGPEPTLFRLKLEE